MLDRHAAQAFARQVLAGGVEPLWFLVSRFRQRAFELPSSIVQFLQSLDGLKTP